MVKISDLFDVKRGNAGAPDSFEAGSVLLVSATTYNAGVTRLVSPTESDVVFGKDGLGSISVAIDGDGSVMFAVPRRATFIATVSVEVLEPREPMDFSRLIAVAAILRASRWRFSYGRKPGGRLGDLELDEAIIERIASQVKVEAPKPVSLQPSVLHQVVAKLCDLYGDNPTIGDVFELKQGKATSVATLSESGAIPVVSATEKEVNAVAGYLDNSDGDLMPSGSISVAKDGKPGVARLQPAPFRATEHAIALVPRHEWTNSEKLILASLIERQCWRFSFARAAAESRLADIRLLDGFPVKPACPQAA